MILTRTIIVASLSVLFIAAMAPIMTSAQSGPVVYVWSNNGYNFHGMQTIEVEGHILPSPGPGTNAVVYIVNPADSLVSIGVATVDGSTGLFNINFVTGGSLWSMPGNYTVYVQWADSLTSSYDTWMTISYTP
jgi:hypothetical protein